MSVILSAWLLWVALQILLLLLAGLLGGGTRTNGLWIRISADTRSRLTAAELAAVIAHEHGHRARLHAFENLVRACIFLRRSARRAAQQEIEADDWAAARGHAAALASAIRKLSSGKFAAWRARRLEGSPPGGLAAMSADDFKAAACTGKKTYGFQHARRLAREVSRRHDEPMQHYHCTWCKGWHIGRPRAGAKRRRKDVQP